MTQEKCPKCGYTLEKPKRFYHTTLRLKLPLYDKEDKYVGYIIIPHLGLVIHKGDC